MDEKEVRRFTAASASIHPFSKLQNTAPVTLYHVSHERIGPPVRDPTHQHTGPLQAYQPSSLPSVREKPHLSPPPPAFAPPCLFLISSPAWVPHSATTANHSVSLSPGSARVRQVSVNNPQVHKRPLPALPNRKILTSRLSLPVPSCPRSPLRDHHIHQSLNPKMTCADNELKCNVLKCRAPLGMQKQAVVTICSRECGGADPWRGRWRREVGRGQGSREVGDGDWEGSRL